MSAQFQLESKPMGSIKVENLQISFKDDEFESVLEALLENDIDVDHSCGGMGSCGTCRILIKNKVKLHERSELERDLSEMYGYEDHERLSCQLKCRYSLDIEIP